MKLNANIHNAVRSGVMVGDTKPCGRVTVEPDWVLETTPPVWDGSIRGPFRYYQDLANPGLEIELPNIKSINIERSLSQDIATCTISVYNQWHDSNGASTPIPMSPELATQLGKPGYFWPQRGESVESQVRWSQEPGSGAYEKDGTYDPSFDWTNVVVPNALLRTYQGYGGSNDSIDTALDNDNIMLTGVWLIDRISAGTDGMLTIECRDVGRLLLEQLTFPPLVPDAIYPLEYVPAGKSPFDSTFSPTPRSNGVSPASFGQARLLYFNSSTDVILGGSSVNGPGNDTGVFGNKGSYASDGNFETFAFSPAVEEPMDSDGYFWWEFALEKSGGSGRKIQGITFLPWAGGYTAYISIKRSGSWLGTDMIPGGITPKTYIKKINVPLRIPDGNEKEIDVDFGQPIEADYVRITLAPPMYYSGQADNSGNQYRCGIKNIYARTVGSVAPSYESPVIDQPWSFAMASHPVRGYWVCESNGYVHGFGDASNYDSSSFGSVIFEQPPLEPVYIPINGIWTKRYLNRIPDGAYPSPVAVDMAAHPSGEGYWILDNTGRVYNYGIAELHLGYHPGFNSVFPPYNRLPDWVYYVKTPWYGELFAGMAVTAMSIAATHTGDGYWVVYSDGSVRGFGDAEINGSYFWQTPRTSVTNAKINERVSITPIYYHNPDNSHSFPGTTPRANTDAFGFRVAGRASNEQMYGYYNISRRGTAIAAHPYKNGFWVSDGSGQIWGYGDVEYFGQLKNRVYNENSATSFRIGTTDFPHGMCSTKTGKGYWLSFTSGKIAAFGDAVNQGTHDVYLNNPAIDIQIPPEKNQDWSFFKNLIWDIDRDPDGSGFWVQVANGDVKSYNSKDWGRPGYYGKTGYRWTQGNYQEYSDIVKDLLSWSGFTAYDGSFDETIKRWDGVASFSVPTLSLGQSYSVGDFTLRMDASGPYVGELVLRESSSATPTPFIVWRSGNSFVGQNFSNASNGNKLLMQRDGNLVIYTSSNSPKWASGTAKNIGAYLVLRDDGHLSVVSPGGSDLVVLHRGSPNAYDRPGIYGNIESTGIYSDKNIPGDKFDKRTVLDCINEIKQVVGYNLYVDQDGRVHFESPNWWQSGNFDDDGLRIYVTYDEEGNFTRVSESTAGSEPFVPEINETVSLTNYSSTLDGDSLRSQIIIGSDIPDENNPSATSYIKYAPGSATDEIRPGVPALRNIIRPAVWIDNTFTNKDEQRIMAELINLQIWFSQRTGSITCIANPNFSINDQIRILERNTSETYIHYIRSISSSMDLDSGQYIMNLTTNWLGDSDNWVITSSNIYNPISNISVSEKVDRWQRVTGRNLAFTGAGTRQPTFTGSLEFKVIL